MTPEQTKEARDMVQWLRDRAKNSDCWCPNSKAADTLTAALDEIERLREALTMIATHRAKCHAHDEDMGHDLREFDMEDVRLMEFAARASLKGSDQ